MKKSLLLFSAIFLGILCPWAAEYSFLIPYGLGVMLFFPFSKWDLSLDIFKSKSLYYLLFANILIGFAAYFLVLSFDKNLALVLFLTGITPAATAGPAVLKIYKKNFKFGIAAVFITNLAIGIILPIAFWLFGIDELNISPVMKSIAIVLFLPLILAQLFHALFPKILNKFTDKFEFLPFISWLLVLFLPAAKASSFLQENFAEFETVIIGSFLGALILTIINYSVGYFIGEKGLKIETSQMLGQKNTMLTVWVALNFISPLASIGPIFYMIFHNLVNAYRMHKFSKEK